MCIHICAYVSIYIHIYIYICLCIEKEAEFAQEGRAIIGAVQKKINELDNNISPSSEEDMSFRGLCKRKALSRETYQHIDTTQHVFLSVEILG